MALHLPRIESLDVAGKTVFVRVDWNLPLDKNNDFAVTDTTRLEKSLPTLKLLQQRGARVVVATHLGRPKGKENPDMSTSHLLKAAEKELDNLQFCKQITGATFETTVRGLENGQILLIENVRFHPGEEKNDPILAKAWANVCDIYVNDAFGAAHRAHSSTSAIAGLLPAYAGLLLQKEVEALSTVLERPTKPFVAIIGGAKVSSKLEVLRNLISKVDTLIIGGGMAYTFLKSRAVPIGNSLVEQDQLVNAFQIIERAELDQVNVLLPQDHVIGNEFSPKSKSKTVGRMDIPDGWMGMDIGPKTIDAYEREIKGAGTILWNGPLGVFEFDKFAKGTVAIAKAVARSKATSIVGGGDSLAAINKAGVGDKITHVSTGGGASLEFLEGRELPGVAALLKNQSGG